MKTSTIRLFTIAFFAITAAATGDASAHGGMGGGGRGIVPVHGSPSMNGGVLVTHGNLKFTPIQNIVRDHRTGLPGRRCGGSQPCWGDGGLGYGQKPAQLLYGYQLPQGGQVRDHRH